ncbi:hypothetical protein ADUPG1_007696 [Aduncisulcus paluster]|uniref:Uncharacterized protein n=1 Tax=Aduncisulcus paluster TaxID=2918883 RepID=A0ABQ5KP85_9EUKA|nr:hypothetical protein ADUPG1_007696 [Aduncisulcus paluster]
MTEMKALHLDELKKAGGTYVGRERDRKHLLEVDSLKKQLERAQTSCSEAISERDHLRVKVGSQIQDIISLKTVIHKLESDLARCKREIVSQGAKLSQAREERTIAISERENLVKKFESEKETWFAEVRELREQLRKKSQTLMQLTRNSVVVDARKRLTAAAQDRTGALEASLSGRHESVASRTSSVQPEPLPHGDDFRRSTVVSNMTTGAESDLLSLTRTQTHSHSHMMAVGSARGSSFHGSARGSSFFDEHIGMSVVTKTCMELYERLIKKTLEGKEDVNAGLLNFANELAAEQERLTARLDAHKTTIERLKAEAAGDLSSGRRFSRQLETKVHDLSSAVINLSKKLNLITYSLKLAFDAALQLGELVGAFRSSEVQQLKLGKFKGAQSGVTGGSKMAQLLEGILGNKGPSLIRPELRPDNISILFGLLEQQLAEVIQLIPKADLLALKIPVQHLKAKEIKEREKISSSSKDGTDMSGSDLNNPLVLGKVSPSLPAGHPYSSSLRGGKTATKQSVVSRLCSSISQIEAHGFYDTPGRAPLRESYIASQAKHLHLSGMSGYDQDESSSSEEVNPVLLKTQKVMDEGQCYTGMSFKKEESRQRKVGFQLKERVDIDLESEDDHDETFPGADSMLRPLSRAELEK